MPIQSSNKQKVPYGRKKNMVHITHHKGGLLNIEDIGKIALSGVSKKVINPVTQSFTKTMVSNKFGDRYAEAIDKAIQRELEKNPMLILDKLSDSKYWENAFKTTHEFLKNDATMKRWKEPIGDALSFIPIVGDALEQGWRQLTQEDGKETDLAENLNKLARKIKQEEKTFKKYGIAPPPLAIGFASAEGYKKAIDDYRTKYKKQLLKMKADVVLKKIKEGNGTKRAGEGLKRAGSGTKRAGDGLKRAGSGTRRAGEGLKRAGSGTKRAGEGLVRAGGEYKQKGLGEELREEMLETYCK